MIKTGYVDDPGMAKGFSGYFPLDRMMVVGLYPFRTVGKNLEATKYPEPIYTNEISHFSTWLLARCLEHLQHIQKYRKSRDAKEQENCYFPFLKAINIGTEEVRITGKG